ncbi:hypothetical protein [Nostoc sp. FACHB-152]|uniref:hypothetical protein n=1 Tax=Nostoc sp. FACHB-152 TaxID=2692837 RepID=UPI001F558245|nr:hypothetical protein [Nostoc sp. FACHB-152]
MATEQELKSLFNTLYTDQDGKISINELYLTLFEEELLSFLEEKYSEVINLVLMPPSGHIFNSTNNFFYCFVTT